MTTFNFKEVRQFLHSKNRSDINEYLGPFINKFKEWEREDRKTFWNFPISNEFDYDHDMVKKFFGSLYVKDSFLEEYDFPIVNEEFRDKVKLIHNEERFLEVFAKALNIRTWTLPPYMLMEAIHEKTKEKYTSMFGNILYDSWRNFRIPVGNDYEEVPDFIWPIIA